ncbi:MAG TPA: hypothetical protein VKV35_01660 [Streptosporangiaceae bacterium]|nr:hypothetical protein [Streptosporangiaceae bacterium]
MHPEIARALVSQRQAALAQVSAEIRRARACPRAGRRLTRRLPRWQVTWTRTVLAPAAQAAGAGGAGRRGTSLVIIISAHRPA